ncbi:MAG: hydroxymethylglutaryl-CoA lyase [Chitinophagaceae bacterium]|nr:MAG: hydroxymethylglutaryl-CoA lyase [Chitinophagaceae bacterium]
MQESIPIQLVECPRDAMQGWPHLIPTEKKIAYLNALLQVGFHTLDFGSFVSTKAIPQMADTKEVLEGLELGNTNTKLLAIVANERGAAEAVQYDIISYLGFPFSISETFQKRNTNSSISESLERVSAIQQHCQQHKKELVIYLSMGFGNPYGDAYNEDILLHWASEMVERGIKILSLADTVGLATPEQISFALNTLQPQYPDIDFGVHLHATAGNWQPKLEAAINAGCRRIDGALLGIGGCPMAGNDLVGNMNTDWILSSLEASGIETGINREAYQHCVQLAKQVFV